MSKKMMTMKMMTLMNT